MVRGGCVEPTDVIPTPLPPRDQPMVREDGVQADRVQLDRAQLACAQPDRDHVQQPTLQPVALIHTDTATADSSATHQQTVAERPATDTRCRQAQAAAKDIHRTLIMSDSTCRNIRAMDAKSLVDKRREDVEVSKHPGATADQIRTYLDWWYVNYNPNNLIICAGVNDLLYENRKCTRNKEDLCNEPDIVEKLIDIGIEARIRGVTDIHFCKLYTIDQLYDGYTSRFNHLLEQRCTDYGFNVVSNSDIDLCDLSDGLHVDSKRGHAKLKHNIMKCCSTYVHRNVHTIVRHI